MRSANTEIIPVGRPVTAPVLIPVIHCATPRCVDDIFMVGGRQLRVTCMSFGNPLGVVFVKNLERVDVPRLGTMLGDHALFPEGASIVFAETYGRERVYARFWQHWEGERDFSAEGACAAVTAAIMTQRITAREADVSMGGREYHVKWSSCDDTVYLVCTEELAAG